MPGLARPTFQLPDGLVNWPWSRQLNVHYRVVKAESDAWIQSFDALDDRAQRAFDKCNFSLLACLAYPAADKDRARAACDLMNLFFLFDELSDVANEREVQEQADAILDALRHPFKHPDVNNRSTLGDAARQFARRTIAILSPSCYTRFVDAFIPHVEAMAQQAHDRSCGYSNRQTVEGYMSVRRGTIGAKPAFLFLEGDEDIPEWVLGHPLLEKLEACVMDMLIMSNDIYSYNVEQARGDDGHNIVSVVMVEQGFNLHEAMRWVESQYLDVVKQFLKAKERLPSWGASVDAQVSAYIYGLANWARAGDQWCFESERYFGRRGLEIQKSRQVELLPRQDQS
ncbi:terpenoid synthase [Heliocybe sulcata]|uniref:Terpene synthase n=1 Tax=Heliocybe sulcata TaxID=5364 RepID=A0A5C3MS01_9AGAM|nr:terpenoid synthase [Heliocybe sulcata]